MRNAPGCNDLDPQFIRDVASISLCPNVSFVADFYKLDSDVNSMAVPAHTSSQQVTQMAIVLESACVLTRGPVYASRGPCDNSDSLRQQMYKLRYGLHGQTITKRCLSRVAGQVFEWQHG
jgi:hypothetical protein